MLSNNELKEKVSQRATKLHYVFMAISICIIIRLFWIQFLSAQTSTNADKMYDKVFNWYEVQAHRGSILSRDGQPLATSIYNYQVEMDYGSEGFDSLAIFHDQSDSLAKLLSLYFKDKSAAAYRNMMRNGRKAHYSIVYKKDSMVYRSNSWFGRFVDRVFGNDMKSIKIYDTIRDHKRVPLLPRQVDYTEWQTLRKYPILNLNMGMTYNLSQTDTRIYPQGELARRTIGKLMGDRGQDYGIEDVCSAELAACTGKELRQRIARGFYGKVMSKDNIDPVDGCDVVTSIDIDVQDVATRSLHEQLKKQNAIWGTTIVMEVETGDIVAIANLGKNSQGNYVENRNYAIGGLMEPGSTFKLAAMLALLEVADMSPDQVYDSGDGKPVHLGRKVVVRDSHAGYSEVDLKTAVAQSLNGYFATAVYENFKDNEQGYVDFLRTLHLDRTVGLDEFGALTPKFRDTDSPLWTDQNTIVYLGYGYGIEITPMHTLTLYNAIANGGKMVAPRIIKEIRRDGDVVKDFPVKVLNRKICSNHTLNIVKECLEETAKTGTAKYYLGKFNDFTVAAKTGTAQIAQDGKGYHDAYYLGSMVSYMPADDPKYTVMTAVYTRRGYGTTYYGAGLAGDVLKQVIQHLYNREMKWYDKLVESDTIKYPAKIKGGDVEQIKEVTYKLSPHTADYKWSDQWGRTSVDSLSNASIAGVTMDADIMPNVVGMGLKDALFLLENRGLKVSFSGQGSIYRQSIAAGRKIAHGNIVYIALR